MPSAMSFLFFDLPARTATLERQVVGHCRHEFSGIAPIAQGPLFLLCRQIHHHSVRLHYAFNRCLRTGINDAHDQSLTPRAARRNRRRAVCPRRRRAKRGVADPSGAGDGALSARRLSVLHTNRVKTPQMR